MLIKSSMSNHSMSLPQHQFKATLFTATCHKSKPLSIPCHFPFSPVNLLKLVSNVQSILETTFVFNPTSRLPSIQVAESPMLRSRCQTQQFLLSLTHQITQRYTIAVRFVNFSSTKLSNARLHQNSAQIPICPD